MSWAYLRQFPSLVWIVILGTFMGAYHLLHGLAPLSLILLYRDYGLSATLIGLILGATAALSTLVASMAAGSPDKWGGATSRCSAAWCPPPVWPCSASHQVGWLALGVIGSGLSYGLIDSPGKALMADNLAEPKARELALHLRYFPAQPGAAIGPLLGVTYGLSARQETFLLLS